VKIYGLIGKHLSHSFSKKYFDEKFVAENLQQTFFNLYELAEVQQMPNIVTPHMLGLAVTIPYKTAVIPFLTEVDEVAQKINAVNCIKIENGKLKGYNTDYIGFLKSIQPYLQTQHTKALVLGSGGAALAIQFALQSVGIICTTVSRQPLKNSLLYSELNDAIINEHKLIVNCTPLGTFPNIASLPQIPYEYITAKHLLYDLVYNPAKTAFLQQAEVHGATIINGYQMLVNQAEENWKIWNS
jgi:shikimate dehydrogenase